MSSEAAARMGADGKEEDRPGWHQQVGQGFDDWMESRVARYQTRKYDWDVLKFQADHDPKYRRAQMRYMGTGGTGLGDDNNTVPSEHFTFSTMVLPPGCEGPPHIHTDVEEVFFMLRGSIRLTVQDGDKKWESVLKERDLISVPPGVYRELINEGHEEALMCVMLGASKPVTPSYPADHPLASIKRDKK